MSAVEYRFLEPLDVLFLRGNKLFGDPGSFGESFVPPWPSVAAGAIRSRMLADDGINLTMFAKGNISHPALGTPKEPGSFSIIAFTLARRLSNGMVEPLIAPPADLVITRHRDKTLNIRPIYPQGKAAGLASSYPLPLLPILAEAERSKPVSGYWLTQSGWAKYLKNEVPVRDDFVSSSELWKIDPRVGVGLDPDMRCTAEGRLFSVQAVALKKREHYPQKRFDVGFLVGISGAQPPKAGMVRLGGDGRAAAITAVESNILESDYEAIISKRCCRLILATPGIFSQGWLPTGITKLPDGMFRFDLHGVKGRLVCAAVPRSEVISGWDVANNAPKPALRVVPVGSVYWLDELDATADALRQLVEKGLWSESYEDKTRRTEGFNRVWLAQWKS